MNYYIVDAFTEKTFGGNPAGVCILDRPLDENTMQKIASENNLSETAFALKTKDGYDLKWFTPKSEIDLCGHATLATAFVISNFIDTNINKMYFSTVSGVLEVIRKDDLYTMNFPSWMPKKIKVTEEIIDALGETPTDAYLSRDLILIYDNEDIINKINPDFAKLELLSQGLGVIITSVCKSEDFVSRCFFPKLGVNEDPVTGSAHSSLIPFWYTKLNKTNMIAKQLSRREGILNCEFANDRVNISGKAALYLKGKIYF